MTYKMSYAVNEIDPLFIELSKLERDEELNNYVYWKERVRWIRFEEQAENVAGRWSKPYVATIPLSALEELKNLVQTSNVILDCNSNNLKDISETIGSSLLDYFGNSPPYARRFSELMCLKYIHHHEKRLRRNSFNSFNSKMSSSELNNLNNNQEIDSKSSKDNFRTRQSTENVNESYHDFKENSKFKKKLNERAEGASVLIMPLDFVDTTKLVFVRFESAAVLPGLLEVKMRSRFIVLIIGPIDRQIQLYEVGRAFSACLADDICRELFYLIETRDDLSNIVKTFSRSSMFIPASSWNPKIRIEPPEKCISKEERKANCELTDYLHAQKIDLHFNNDPTLKATLKPFNGLLKDIKRKASFYLSDFTDSMNLQCTATTLYMYLVTLCSLVAFGGLFGQKTNNLMATMECILSGAISNALFALFAGQPLNIISATGPVLILETIIKTICDKYKIEFLEFRLWIGIWSALILVLLVVFNLSFLVKYITRFTEDCFSAMVAIVFIIDAVRSLYKLKNFEMPSQTKNLALNGTGAISFDENFILLKAHNESKFYFSCILFILTFLLCVCLKDFQNKPYLPSKIRNFLSDFAVLISITIASLINHVCGVNTLKLNIPSVFQPTSSERETWLIPFYSGKNPWYTIPLAIVPALIAAILIFMDQQITAVIANRKEFKLKKSHGYHLDLLSVSISLVVTSLLGLPWMVAATVLTLSHINSLKVMSKNTAPGERPVFVGIREQRGTALFMSILVGLSIFFTPILSNIPMAALYGVFMFMGTSTLNGLHFVQRILILLMPVKHQPDYKFLRHVNLNRVHLFTILQILSTSLLFVIKYTDFIAISFPIMIVGTAGIRKLFDFLFTQRELFWLDDILPGKKVDIKIMKSSTERVDQIEMEQVMSKNNVQSVSMANSLNNLSPYHVHGNTQERENSKERHDQAQHQQQGADDEKNSLLAICSNNHEHQADQQEHNSSSHINKFYLFPPNQY